MFDGDLVKAKFFDCVNRDTPHPGEVTESDVEKLIHECQELLRNNPGITRDEARRLLTNHIQAKGALPAWLIMLAVRFLVMLIINNWFEEKLEGQVIDC